MKKTKPKTDPKPMGRPPVLVNPKRVTVNLTATEIETALKLGSNISDGIRESLKASALNLAGKTPKK